MVSRCSRLIALLPIAFVLTFSTVAFGQLDGDKDAQKCIDFYNNKLRLVSKMRALEDRNCIKNAGKGKEPGASDPDGCLSGDPKGKVLKFTDKAIELTEDPSKGKCFQYLPGGVPVGDEIYNGDTAASAAVYVSTANELTRKIFGDPVSPAIFDANDKDRGKCQDKVMLRAVKVLDKVLTEHRVCKKLGMKDGLINGTADLESVCMSDGSTNGVPDGKGKIAKLIQKLTDDTAKFCTTPGVDTDTFLPGNCVGTSGAAFSSCVEAAVQCTACESLNANDGTSRDCDIFDDGAANASCGVPTIGTHKCTFDPSSSLLIHTEAFSLPDLGPTGAIDISCGAIDAGTGKAPCSCDVQTFGDLQIPAIGDVCVVGAGPCPAGEIDCDGGNSMDVNLVADHNIGACTGNGDCASQCAISCGGAAMLDSGCEGFCEGGVSDGLACTLDADCVGGNCAGGDPVAHAGSCNCTCAATGLGAPSPAGSLSCSLGTQISVELPASGVCGDATPSIVLPPVCGRLSTTIGTGTIFNANGGVGTVVDPNAPLTGAPFVCNDLAASITSGAIMGGHLSFFDSTLGDLLTANRFVCQ